MNKNLTRNDLALLVAAGYGNDNICLDYWDFDKSRPKVNSEPGDTLALFAMSEFTGGATPVNYIDGMTAALEMVNSAQSDLEHTDTYLRTTVYRAIVAEYLEWLVSKSFGHTEGRWKWWVEINLTPDQMWTEVGAFGVLVQLGVHFSSAAAVITPEAALADLKSQMVLTGQPPEAPDSVFWPTPKVEVPAEPATEAEP